ncbi:MAG TPA: NACHT domain-containing protein [Chthoniobacterales bacterium]|jgi:hypothetical protein|nr:NACHT domain-containing protein [Chthoniobacterales bacterium]
MQLASPNQFLRVPAAIELNLEIDDMFVPLVLEQQGLNQGFDDNTVLTAGTRIRIIGDPGSGKSSIAKKIFRDECKRALEAPRRAHFPILLELRSIDIPHNVSTVELQEWLFNYLKRQAGKYEVYELLKCLDAFSTTTGLLVLLDGLDEVASSAYVRMETAINGLSQRLSQLSDKNIILLTMRTQFHQQVRTSYSETFPTVLSIRRFLPGDIYEFLQRWPFSPGQKANNVVRIYNDLSDRPTLREMCTNPLVLSMYVAQDQISGDAIAPDSRTDFYQKVVEELLIKRRAKQIGAMESQTIVREQRQSILGLIAFRHLLDTDQTVNRIAWRFGVDAVIEVTKLKVPEAEAYLRELSKETGLVTEEQEGETLRFIHLTFCEYFCAFEAIQGRRDGWQALVRAHIGFGEVPELKTRLVEVLPFAAALTPRHMRPQAITDVAACRDRRLLALAFLETKLYTHELWPIFLDSSQAELIGRDESEWNADWLREVHLFLVVASDAERSAAVLPGIIRPDGVLRFFQDFAQKSSSAIAKLISKYSEQDAVAAFRVATLCGIDIFHTLPEIVIERSDQPPFVAVAIERSLREPEKIYGWASLFAEAGLRSAAAASVLSRWAQRPWHDLAENLPHKNGWYVPNIVNPNHLTDCFALGSANPDLNADITPTLCELAQISNFNARGFRFSFAMQKGTKVFWFLYVFLSLAAFLSLLFISFLGYNSFMGVSFAGNAIVETLLNSCVLMTLFFVFWTFLADAWLYWLRVYLSITNQIETIKETKSSRFGLSIFNPFAGNRAFATIEPLDRIAIEGRYWRSLFIDKATILHGDRLLTKRAELRRTSTITTMQNTKSLSA